MIDMPYQVMLVDDSAAVRGLLSRWLETEQNLQVAAYAASGPQALSELERHELDVIVLDTDMPEMDGLQVLASIMRSRPDLKVIMACTPSQHDAEISLKALQAGAADYVVKPVNSQDMRTNLDFRREIVEKIKALAAARRRKKGLSSNSSLRSAGHRESPHTLARPTQVVNGSTGGPRVDSPQARQSIKLRKPGKARPEILAIGSSTGGPQALHTLFKTLRGHLTIPVVITQHMPADFTAIFTEQLSRVVDGVCKEGEDGEKLVDGNIYLAPGDHHMLIVKRGSEAVLKITRDPPENFCRPAVDPMMRSLRKVYADRVLTVILTGMGQDGLSGCRELVDAGSTLIAQDEASSVVWGMPGAVASAGLCSAVLPLDQIGQAVVKMLQGKGL